MKVCAKHEQAYETECPYCEPAKRGAASSDIKLQPMHPVLVGIRNCGLMWAARALKPRRVLLGTRAFDEFCRMLEAGFAAGGDGWSEQVGLTWDMGAAEQLDWEPHRIEFELQDGSRVPASSARIWEAE